MVILLRYGIFNTSSHQVLTVLKLSRKDLQPGRPYKPTPQPHFQTSRRMDQAWSCNSDPSLDVRRSAHLKTKTLNVTQEMEFSHSQSHCRHHRGSSSSSNSSSNSSLSQNILLHPTMPLYSQEHITLQYLDSLS